MPSPVASKSKIRRPGPLTAMVATALFVGAACAPVVVNPPSILPPVGDCAPLAPAALATPQAEPKSLTVSEAGASATQAVASTSASSNSAVTLVTAELDDNGSLSIDSHTTTKGEAPAVAKAAAADGDLVAVDVPHPISSQATTTATDPMRPDQWALNDVRFESVWPRRNGTGIKVAVVDSGVQWDHPDLAGRVLSGAQFLNLNPASTGTGQVDGLGHGTHVAGIIAASANNGFGVTGAAPGASILPVRVLDDTGKGWDTDVASGVVWAADHGAKVINMSLGSSNNSQVLHTAITYAVAHGVTVVAAGGNYHTSHPPDPASYPGAYPEVIAVAAVDRTNALADFSTRGFYVDVAAPGVDVLSTYHGSLYALMSGTSMATPYASAAVALLAQEHPTWTPAQLQARLEATATHLGAAGKNPASGRGLINPRAAVGC